MKTNPMMRLLAQNKGRGRFAVQTALVENEAVVYLYDAIVGTSDEAEFFGGVAADDFVNRIAAIKADVIHLRINSPGGSVFAARAMETALRSHSAKIVAHIDGVAASAASFLAMAADEIEISKGAFFMIHKAWTMTFGNADDLLKEAELLEKIDGTLVDTYQARTGLEAEELKNMMSAETWLEAEEAVAKGFADRIGGSQADKRWNLSAYHHAPEQEPETASEPETEQPDRDALARAASVAIFAPAV